MMKQSTSTEDLEALKTCFEAYGADIAKWPEDKRNRFGELGASDEMTALRREAEELDAFLGAASAPRVSADLANRIMAQYDAPARRASAGDVLSGLIENLRARLLPAGALAGVGALGLLSGVMTANAQTALTPEAEAYAYAEDLMVLAAADEEEGAQWDVD